MMTIKTSRDAEWPVARAKARLSALIDRALADGPQVITRNGRDAVVVVSAAEWERKTKRVGNLAEFLAASPLRGAEIVLDRDPARPRDIDL
jgi:prevent-host-death family protein